MILTKVAYRFIRSTLKLSQYLASLKKLKALVDLKAVIPLEFTKDSCPMILQLQITSNIERSEMKQSNLLAFEPLKKSLKPTAVILIVNSRAKVRATKMFEISRLV